MLTWPSADIVQARFGSVSNTLRVQSIPKMRVRIGLCLLAVCWPLLATAAPLFASDPHACCRRDGKHHCAAVSASPDANPAVRANCPYSDHVSHFAGARSARPAPLVKIESSPKVEVLASISHVSPQLAESVPSSSRAPPLA